MGTTDLGTDRCQIKYSLMQRKSKYTKIDNSYTRHDEGVSPDEITEDISSQRLEKLKTSFYQAQAQTIEKKTRQRKYEREV